MSTAYDFNDNMLDFEDTDLFLSAILSSVPAMDKLSNPYDIDQNGLAGFPFTESSGFIGNPNNSLNINPDPSETSSDAVSVNSSSPSTDRSLFPSNNQKQRSSFSSASYSELVASSASNEGTPNTSVLSPHTLPEGMPDHEHKTKPINYSNTYVKTESKDTPEASPVAPPKSKASAKDKVSKPGKRPKVSHNMIEKKYRTNINTKIYELRDAVPTLKIAAGKANVLLSDLKGLAPAAKLNKASVLTKATEYIKHLEKKNDTMLSQIAQLQQLIGEANANPPNVMPNQPLRVDERQPNMGMQNNYDGQFSGGFGFAPENNYNTTVNQYDMQSVPPQFAQQVGQQEGYQPYNSNWMMGGFAAVMGSSVLSNENFKGLAALPFMPSFLTHPSPATLQLLSIFRFGLFVFGIYLMISPIVNFIKRPRDPKAPVESQWGTWLLVSLGLQVPKPLSQKDKDRILALLNGGCPEPWSWLKEYAILCSSEVTFETCFLTVLVGTIITTQLPIFSKLIGQSLKTRAALLRKLDTDDEDAALKKLSHLIKSTDGASLFASEELITRVLNLSAKKNILAGVKGGENSLAYVEVYKRNTKDVYAIIFGWRVLDLLHELSLSYLDFLTLKHKDEGTKSAERSLESEIDAIGQLLDNYEEESLKLYYLALKCLIHPASTPTLVNAMKESIMKTMLNVNSYFDGQDLTDVESLLDSETESLEESSDETETAEGVLEPKITETVKTQKSLVYSLNLVNEEKFIVLATSSILFYLHKEDDNENLRHLLRHLKFKSDEFPLSTLSFACLMKVVCGMLETGENDQRISLSVEESEILELLVKAMRGWLNDDRKNKFLDHSFRSDLTDLVMTKGMLLHNM